MTKHNVEMESNKEQSRVCARLPHTLTRLTKVHSKIYI